MSRGRIDYESGTDRLSFRARVEWVALIVAQAVKNEARIRRPNEVRKKLGQLKWSRRQPKAVRANLGSTSRRQLHGPWETVEFESVHDDFDRIKAFRDGHFQPHHGFIYLTGAISARDMPPMWHGYR